MKNLCNSDAGIREGIISYSKANITQIYFPEIMELSSVFDSINLFSFMNLHILLAKMYTVIKSMRDVRVTSG